MAIEAKMSRWNPKRSTSRGSCGYAFGKGFSRVRCATLIGTKVQHRQRARRSLEGRRHEFKINEIDRTPRTFHLGTAHQPDHGAGRQNVIQQRPRVIEEVVAVAIGGVLGEGVAAVVATVAGRYGENRYAFTFRIHA